MLRAHLGTAGRAVGLYGISQGGCVAPRRLVDEVPMSIRFQEAMTILRTLPTLPMAPLPGQADLDALLLAGTHGSDPNLDSVAETDDLPAGLLVSVG